jgi:hypothetical protein
VTTSFANQTSAAAAGLTALQELSLVGCELLTEVGAQHLGGLTRLTSLSLQTCRHIR